MTDEELMQRIRGLAVELNDDPDVDHIHIQAILYAISGLLGMGSIRLLSPIIRDITIAELAKQSLRN